MAKIIIKNNVISSSDYVSITPSVNITGSLTVQENVFIDGDISASGNIVFNSGSINNVGSNRGVYLNETSGVVSYFRGYNADGSEVEIGSDNRIIFTETDNNTKRIMFDLNSSKYAFNTPINPHATSNLITCSFATMLVEGPISASSFRTFGDVVTTGSLKISKLATSGDEDAITIGVDGEHEGFIHWYDDDDTGQYAKIGFDATHYGNGNLLNFYVSNATPAMSISGSGGAIGIGTKKPENRLHLKGTGAALNVGAATIRIENASAAGEDWLLNVSDSGYFQIAEEDGSTRLYFDTDGDGYITNGNLAIGHTTPTAQLDIEGDTITRGNIGTPSFASGFAGSGYRITSGSNGLQSLEIDDLTIRGSMSVYELLIHQIRATNGSLFVSNTGKVASASLDDGAKKYSLFFDSGSGYGHSFVVGDLIRAQRFVPSTNGSGSQDDPAGQERTYKSDLHIISVNGTGSAVAVLSGSDTPEIGMEFVRIGSTATTDRQGSIYLTADDANAPFIDVVDGITSHSHWNTSGYTKTRIGKLGGITSTKFGTLSGYGFYASGSAYLEGSIKATAGEIAGWNISNTTLSKGNVTIDSANEQIKLGSGAAASATSGIFLDSDGLFNLAVDANNFIRNDGSNLVFKSEEFHLSGSTTLRIDNSKIRLGTSADSITLTNGTGIFLDSGGNFRVGTTTNYLKFGGSAVEIATDNLSVDSSGNVTMAGAVTATSGKIGGFEITDTAITGSGFFLSGSAGGGGTTSWADEHLFISTSDFQINGAGVISASAGNIGGFTIDSDEIKTNTSDGIILDADSNGGIIKVGKSVGSITFNSDSNRGFYVDGNGNFRVGKKGAGYSRLFYNSANDHLEITSSNIILSGSDVNILTPKFYMGESSQYISGSNGNIEISSSKFHLQNDGDVVMNNITASNAILSGKLTSTEGAIGGFSIGSQTLSANNIELDSTQDNGQIRIGGADKTSGEGFYADGNGIVWMGDYDGNRIYLNKTTDILSITSSNVEISGSNVDIQTPKFFLGKHGSQFVSGSSNKIEISSSNFHLANDGKVNLQGNVTMSSNVRIEGGLQVGALPVTPTDDKLISYYTYDSDTTQSLVEDNVLDLSGNGRNASWGGGGLTYTSASFIDGVVGKAIQWSGSLSGKSGSMYLGHTIPAAERIFVTGSVDGFTMATWFKTTDTSGHTILGIDIQSTGSIVNSTGTVEQVGDTLTDCNGWWLGYNDTNILGDVTDGGHLILDQGSFSYPVVVDDGEWHHLAMTYNKTTNTGSLYHNGVKLYTRPGNRFITGSNQVFKCLVGTGPGSAKGYGDAAYDETRFYLRDLSENEVKALYLNPSAVNSTAIQGDQLTTGKIQSNNWTDSGTEGTEINLNDGTFKMGGDTNPDLEFDGSTLTVSGTISSSVGNIGGWTIDSTNIKAAGIDLISSNVTSEINIGAATAMTTGTGVYIDGNGKFRAGQESDNFIRFNNTANVLEIKTPSLDLDSSGNLTISGTLSASYGDIAGWSLNPTNLTNIDSTGGISIDAGNKIITARTGSASDTVRVRFGQINAGQYGIQGEDTAGNTIFDLGEQGNKIAGFEFSQSAISNIGAHSEKLLILSSSGQVTGSAVKFDEGGTIGGWTIGPKGITAGTNMHISSSNPRITINSTTFGEAGIQLEYNSGNPKFYVGEGGSNPSASFIRYENKKITLGSGVTLGFGASGGEGVNLINTDDWRITSGSSFSQTSDYPEHYSPSGTTIDGIKRENVIKEIIGPDSSSLVKAWGMIPNNNYGSDGGWNGDFFPINNQKTYAFTEYVMFKTALTGSVYLGVYAGKDLNNNGVSDGGGEISSSLAEGMGLHGLTGTSAPPRRGGVKTTHNNYFLGETINGLADDKGVELHKWYFLVAYINPHNSDNTIHRGGMYDVETGAKVKSLADFMWTPSSSVALHRTYHYYNTEGSNTDGNDGSVYQWVTQPGVYEVNGGEVNVSNFIDIGSAVAKGTYSGSQTFISEKSIFSPVIGGNDGYFNETFRVGAASSGIHITGSGNVPNIKSGDYVAGTSGWIIDTGSAEFNEVTVRGTVIASAGDFSGSLSASSGQIGGWTIGTNQLSAGGNLIRLDSTPGSEYFEIGTLSSVTDVAQDTEKGLFADASGNVLIKNLTEYVQFNGGKVAIQTDALKISDGNLTISGTVSASIGNIGGWTIDDSTLTAGNITIDSTTDSGKITIGSNSHIELKGSNTSKIANWNVDSSHIYRSGEIYIQGSSNKAKIFMGASNANATSSAAIMLSGSGEGWLANKSIEWDKAGNLNLDADVTIGSGSLAGQGAPLLETFSSSSLDESKWLTANLQQTASTNPVGITFRNSHSEAWNAGFMSRRSFRRSNSTVIETDIRTNNGSAPKVFIGFVSASVEANDLENTTNWNHYVEAVYVSGYDFRVYSDLDNDNSSNDDSNTLFGTGNSENVWSVVDDDRLFRVRISLKPTKGAIYELFRDGDYTNPIASHQTEGNTGEEVKVAVMFNLHDTNSNTVLFEQLGVNHGLSNTTRISGNTITTGVISSSNYTYTGGDYSTTGTVFDLDKGDIRSQGFFISGSGKTTFSGSVSSSEGNIGGWTIGADKIEASNIVLNTNASGNPAIYLNGKNSFGANVNGVWIGTDGISIGDADEFNVTHQGALTATNATITGNITATSGKIANWDIVGNHLSGSNITLDAAGSRIYKSDENSETTGYYMDFTPGTNYYVRFGTNFAVSSSGMLIASGAKIEGVLTSSAGKIANWDITTNKLSTTNVDIDSANEHITLGAKGSLTDGNTGVYIGTDGIAVGASSVFKVTSAGAVTATNATITGAITATSGEFTGDIEATHINTDSGSIGGFKIDTNEISASGLLLKSTGQITASNADLTGKITATNGAIGGFTIGSNTLTTTNAGIGKTGQNQAFWAGDDNQNAAEFRVSHDGLLIAENAIIDGTITATDGAIGNFSINSVGIADGNKNLILSASGQITGSKVKFIGGDIGGFSLSETQISASGVLLKTSARGIGGQITSSRAFFDGGQIGGFEITTTEVRTTSSKFEGMTIDKDFGIRGKGDNHSTVGRYQSFEGEFHFGTAMHSVGPGGGGQTFDPDGEHSTFGGGTGAGGGTWDDGGSD